jgi:hypothetical protein
LAAGLGPARRTGDAINWSFLEVVPVQKCRWLIACLVLGLVVPVFAQDKDKAKDKDKDKDKAKDKEVSLEWKFKEGKAFYQEMKTETKQTMKVSGTDVPQNQEQTFWFSWTPKQKEADGSWVIEQEIIGVQIKIDIGGTKIEYDSRTETKSANPLGDFFKALIGSKFKLTLNKDYKVTKVEGRDEFLNNLIKANPQMEGLLKSILSDDAIKEMVEPTFGFLPTKKVKEGDKWERTSKLDMGPIGKYENSFKYTYKGISEKADKISVETDVKYIPPADTAATKSNLPFKIKSADLKSTKSSGTILFDSDAGRIKSSETSLDLKGELNIEISGQSTKVELTQTQSTKVTTSDKNPLEKK